MTMEKLQEKLGEQIDMLCDKNTPLEKKKQMADIASTISSLAKQYINSADVTLRAEKLMADGKLGQDSAIGRLLR